MARVVIKRKNAVDPVTEISFVELSSSIPRAAGTASAGVSCEAARADHVHPVCGAATQSANGLMSAADKKKLDGIAAGATATAAPPAAAAAAPKAHGTAAVGTSAKYAREDHVHPSDNTDTHWTSHLYAGASNGNANAATANGATHLIICDNSTVRDRRLIKGAGSVTVTSDASGNITISGTNTTYGAATQAANGLMSAADKKKLDGMAAGATNTAADFVTTGPITIENDPPLINFKNTVDVIDAIPAKENRYCIFNCLDKNGNLCADQYFFHSTAGDKRLLTRLYNPYKKTFVNFWFVYNHVTDTSYVDFPSPVAASNTNQGATTAWVRARISAATGKGATTFSLEPAVMSLNADDAGDAASQSGTGAGLAPENLQCALDSIKAWAMARVFCGFWYELGDEPFYFTYDLYDQQNLADAAILAMDGAAMPLMCRDCDGQPAMPPMDCRTIKDLHKFACAEHKGAIMAGCRDRMAGAAACADDAAMLRFMAGLGLKEDYLERLAARQDFPEVVEELAGRPEDGGLADLSDTNQTE